MLILVVLWIENKNIHCIHFSFHMVWILVSVEPNHVMFVSAGQFAKSYVDRRNKFIETNRKNRKRQE